MVGTAEVGAWTGGVGEWWGGAVKDFGEVEREIREKKEKMSKEKEGKGEVTPKIKKTGVFEKEEHWSMDLELEVQIILSVARIVIRSFEGRLRRGRGRLSNDGLVVCHCMF